jgi:hypothetical protein
VSERDLAIDLFAFAGTVVAASVFRWQARDVIWGLWISSLTVGYATIVLTIVRGVRAVQTAYRVLAIVGGLGMLAFFTFHFGMFHFVHGVFLNGFFPLMDNDGGFPNLAAMATRSLVLFWPLVLATLLSRLPDIMPGASVEGRVRRGDRPLTSSAVGEPKPAGSPGRDSIVGPGADTPAGLPALGKDSFAAAYANVVRMHILIFAFAGLHLAGLSRLAIIPVLAAYFFPWKAVARRIRGRR